MERKLIEDSLFSIYLVNFVGKFQMNKVLIIKNMKKYIISALTFLISFINVEAQYVADGHHMSYKGVSFEESLHDFRQQIKNKGIKLSLFADDIIFIWKSLKTPQKTIRTEKQIH